MPHYHFHFTDGVRVCPDADGLKLPHDEAARNEAKLIAQVRRASARTALRLRTLVPAAQLRRDCLGPAPSQGQTHQAASGRNWPTMLARPDAHCATVR